MRVTSDPTSAITIGIAAITAAAVMLTTGREDATPSKEGRATTSLLPPSLVVTCYRLGLHSSRMGGGETPSPASPWLLSNKHGLVTLKKLYYENRREHECLPRRKRQSPKATTSRQQANRTRTARGSQPMPPRIDRGRSLPGRSLIRPRMAATASLW